MRANRLLVLRKGSISYEHTSGFKNSCSVHNPPGSRVAVEDSKRFGEISDLLQDADVEQKCFGVFDIVVWHILTYNELGISHTALNRTFKECR